MLMCFLLLMFNFFTLRASSDIHLCESELELRYVFLLKLEVLNPILREYFLRQSGVGLLNVFNQYDLIQITVDPVKRESVYQFTMATNIFISVIGYCFHVDEVPPLLMNARKDPEKIYEKMPTLQDLVLAAEKEMDIENLNTSQIAHFRSIDLKPASTSTTRYDDLKEFEGVLYNVSIL
ncbi:uncharacterized protein LOC107268848 [Cephus cinctus]|uniref:Uncharacterized protein LOC107268848 n=1 Tax=Cephus cinctus TaxID=211228 RepID=A0AAJ7FLD2_CEPCN|nr:uncharacterized protein LOC107268848 [Cephus cinctus]